MPFSLSKTLIRNIFKTCNYISIDSAVTIYECRSGKHKPTQKNTHNTLVFPHHAIASHTQSHSEHKSHEIHMHKHLRSPQYIHAHYIFAQHNSATWFYATIAARTRFAQSSRAHLFFGAANAHKRRTYRTHERTRFVGVQTHAGHKQRSKPEKNGKIHPTIAVRIAHMA